MAETSDREITLAAGPQRLRIVVHGQTIADSTNTLVLFETRHADVHYFPRADVNMDFLLRTDHHTHCPFKGDASYWSIEVAGDTLENAAWSYEEPFQDVSEIKEYISFYMDRVTIL